MKEDFVIELDGLKAGKRELQWHADGKFFGDFENSEILDADLDIGTCVEKIGERILVDSAVKGSVTVACDRCLADLKMGVDLEIALEIVFSDAAASSEGERETVLLPRDEEGFDMGQVIYDYVCTSLPVVRTHPEGECDPEVVKYLGHPGEDSPASSPENPFKSLKNLLDKK